jgi:hypothetical protein
MPHRGKDIYKYVAALRAKYGSERWRNSFPDLRTPVNPCTNGFGPTPASKPKPPTNHIVDTLHKQGPQVLTKEDLPWAGGKKP